MAELPAYCEPGDEPKRRLRLVIRWLWITATPDVPGGRSSACAIGLFVGEEQLFNRAVYAREDGSAVRLEDGFFYDESEDGRILRDLREVLATGRTVEIEDPLEPAVRLVIGRDILGRHKGESSGAPPDFFEVLVIVQAGGPWAGRIYGLSGPAVWLDVERAALEDFCRELRQEADNLPVSG
jgi:hypothetical protein